MMQREAMQRKVEENTWKQQVEGALMEIHKKVRVKLTNVEQGNYLLCDPRCHECS